MKHFYLKSLLCMVMMLVGVNAWGDTATITFASGTNGDGTYYFQATSGSISNVLSFSSAKNSSTTNPAYNSTNSDLRLYYHSGGSGGSITLTAADGVTITGFTLTTSTTPTTKYTADTGTATTVSYSNSVATVSNLSCSSLKIQNCNTTNTQLRIKSIAVTYSAANTATAPTLPASCTFTSDSFDVTITNGETGATVYYTTDGTAPTTSSESFTGASKTINISATTTVKAMAVIDGKSNSSVTTATYTKEASIANTEATAYTTAQAIALIDANSSQLATTQVYIKGTVSKVDGFNSTYGSITYWLDSDAFEIYSGLNNNGAKFTSIDDIKVGAEVVVYGYITKYDRSTPVVYETKQNSWLVSYVAPAASKNTATLTLGTYKSALTTGFDDEYTVTYNGDGTLGVTSSDETVADAVIVEGTVTISAKKAGTTTITVSATETENYYAANKSYTLTVTDPAPAATVPFSFDGGKADLTTGMSQTGLGTDYSSSPKLKFDSAGDNVIINYASTARNITYKIKGNSTDSNTVFDVMESADGKTYTSVHSFSGNVPTDATSYTDKLKSDSRYVKFVYTTKSGNVALGAISITNEKADPGLAFEQSTYRFFNYTEGLSIKATSSKGSTGAITYSVDEGDKNAIILGASTGAVYAESEATFTIKATIAETEDYKEATATCTVIFKSHPTGNSIIVAETPDGKYFAMTNTAGDKYITSAQIGKVGDKYVVASWEALDAIKYRTTTSEGKTTIENMTGQYLQATAEKNVSFTDDEYQWTNDGEKLTAATSSYGTLQYNTSYPRFTTYTNKSGQYAQIVSLDNVEVISSTEITISDAKYATYYNSALAYTMPSGCKGYIWGKTENRLVETYDEGAVVPAGEALVIYCEDDDIKILEFTTTSNAKSANNALLGTDTETALTEDNDSYFYALSLNAANDLESVGFYWMNATGAAFTNGAHKAYLKLAKSSGAPSCFVFSGNEEDGSENAISNINAEENATECYDLMGRKSNGKGLMISNSKVMIVK